MDGRVSHKENLVLKFFYVSWDSNQNDIERIDFFVEELGYSTIESP